MGATEEGALRVALYVRVSTDDQAKSGYSIPEQKRTLLDHAERERYEVLETIEDDGWSGASPERPGIRRIYELADAGEIDAVLATKRDRFFRSRLYRLQMDHEMKEHGVKLLSLTDTGNRIGDGVLDDFAEWEREQTAQRTKNGKIEKARNGKVVGGHNRAYGYDYVQDGNGKTVGYAVNEVEVRTVRRIFSEVAGGKGIRTIKENLDAEHVPTPGKGHSWNRTFLRDLICDDLYRPHTVEELRRIGVSEEVMSRLDERSVYGLYRYQGIPVPIPDAGIALEVVQAARHKVRSHRSPSKSGQRFWELSGGILICSECGRRMQAHSVTRWPKSGKTYHYYRCQTITGGVADRCGMKKEIRAETVETEVWDTVRRVMDDKIYVLDKIKEQFDEKRRELSRSVTDPAKLMRRLDGIEKSWTKNKLAYEADAISVADLKARRAELEVERVRIEQALRTARSREDELARLSEEEAEIRQRVEAGYGGLNDASPEKRRAVYEDLRLTVEVGSDARPFISGWFPVGPSLRVYGEGEEPRFLFNASRQPRHRVSSTGTSSWPPSTPTTRLPPSHASRTWEWSPFSRPRL